MPNLKLYTDKYLTTNLLLFLSRLRLRGGVTDNIFTARWYSGRGLLFAVWLAIWDAIMQFELSNGVYERMVSQVQNHFQTIHGKLSTCILLNPAQTWL